MAFASAWISSGRAVAFAETVGGENGRAVRRCRWAPPFGGGGVVGDDAAAVESEDTVCDLDDIVIVGGDDKCSAGVGVFADGGEQRAGESGSSSAVGSSASSIGVPRASASANAARACSPPESSTGLASSR